MAKPTKRIINLLLVTKERPIPYIEFARITDENKAILNGILDRTIAAITADKEDAIEGVEYVTRGGKITDASLWIEIEEMVLTEAQAWITEIGHGKLLPLGWTFVQAKTGAAYWGNKYENKI